MSAVLDNEPTYQAITALPRHIEERLLKFNIMQLCALVSEMNGNRWTGASDRYGPIQEIAKRWDHAKLALRIEDLPMESDIVTYSRIMSAHGGNPALKDPPRERKMDPSVRRTDTSRRTMAPVDDRVAPAMAGCKVEADLLQIVKDQELTVKMETFNRLPNFGLKRMLVGNAWRSKIRKESKQ